MNAYCRRSSEVDPERPSGRRPNRAAAGAVILSKMSSFSAKGLLGELEQLVMLAVDRLGDECYAVSIRSEIQRCTGIDLGRSSVYVTLDRSEERRVGKECSSWWMPY